MLTKTTDIFALRTLWICSYKTLYYSNFWTNSNCFSLPSGANGCIDMG